MVRARPLERPLADLVGTLASREVRGDAALGVTDVVYSSVQATSGALFFCVPGTKTDGHEFAKDAVDRGARALVVQRWLEDLDATQILVPSVRGAMGPVSAAFFEHPSRALTVVGVTGTNGKTTTTYLLESVFRAAGLAPGLIGTTGARIDGSPVPFSRTTPEAPDLHRVLSQMVQRGVRAVAMEVSSHGLDQQRVGGVRFACAVFTNLTRDHLDYHGTMESYFDAKKRLFAPELTERAVVNADDAYGRRLVPGRVPTTTFSIDADDADLRATDVSVSAAGISLRADGLQVRSQLRGGFNVSNCLATVAAARPLGIDDEHICRGIESMPGVPGRVEAVEEGQGFLVLVDYAHTPDSVERVLRSARELAAGRRLIVVLGAGGDRDRSKRPLMGEAAARLADLAVITSDNPRSEDPGAILEQIEAGARGSGRYTVQSDRRAAIRLALGEADPGDVVVIAGKGHETGQELADRTIAFDDRVVAAEELRALRGRA